MWVRRPFAADRWAGSPGSRPDGGGMAAVEPTSHRTESSRNRGGNKVNTRVWIGIAVLSAGSILAQPELSWGDDSRTSAQSAERPATGAGSNVTPGGRPAPTPVSPELLNAQFYAKKAGVPVEQILAERQAGMTWREIAKAHGVGGRPGATGGRGGGTTPGSLGAGVETERAAAVVTMLVAAAAVAVGGEVEAGSQICRPPTGHDRPSMPPGIPTRDPRPTSVCSAAFRGNLTERHRVKVKVGALKHVSSPATGLERPVAAV